MGRRNAGPRLRWLKKRKCYYICWTESGRSRERSTGTECREEAEVCFAEWLSERQKSSGPRDPSEVLVTDILVAYAKDAAHRAETGGVVALERIGFAVAPLATFFEGQFASGVGAEACAMYQRWRKRAQGTVRRELGTLRASMNLAHRVGLLDRPVFVPLPPAPPGKNRWLTRSEVAALLRAARAGGPRQRHVVRFVLLALYSGKRKEAVLSLEWQRVDLERGVIDWERPDAPITRKRRGKNPVNPKLLAHLRRWHRNGLCIGAVITFRGRPMADIRKSFAVAAKRAGLDDVTPHTLRHTAATWLAQSPGVSVFEAAGFLGMTSTTFADRYAHHDPEHQRNAARAF